MIFDAKQMFNFVWIQKQADSSKYLLFYRSTKFVYFLKKFFSYKYDIAFTHPHFCFHIENSLDVRNQLDWCMNDFGIQQTITFSMPTK